VDYYFLDPEEFRRREEAGEFLEHATVYGQRYGTLRAEVGNRLRAGQAVILAIDVQGAAQVRARARADAVLARALVTVFLTPPSLQLLEERLRKRGTEAPEVMARRLAAAREELTHCRHFDYVILSGTIAEDVRRLEAILEAERLRTTRVPLPEL
jgi:guanylate kinase